MGGHAQGVATLLVKLDSRRSIDDLNIYMPTSVLFRADVGQ